VSDPFITEFRATAGHVSAFAGKHLLLLTVTGRRSGHPRTTPLLYLPDGDAFVVFGLNGGAPADPVWVSNLLASDHATIEVGQHTLSVTSERVDGTDAEHLWRRQVDLVPEFTEFRARTTRSIPILRLTPTAPEPRPREGRL